MRTTLEDNIDICLDPDTEECDLSAVEAREMAEEILRLRTLLAKYNSDE